MARREDIAQMVEIYTPYVENTTVSFEYTTPSVEEFTRRFETITQQFPWIVAEEDGRLLGYAYGSAPFSRRAYGFCSELSIYLREECTGKGLGQKLYAVLEEIMKRQGYRMVYALITSENHRSLHFHTKIGYKTTAFFPDCGYKFGHWLGVYWMEKPLNIVECPSQFPSNWMSIVQNAEIFRNILDSLSLS